MKFFTHVLMKWFLKVSVSKIGLKKNWAHKNKSNIYIDNIILFKKKW